MKTIKLLLPAVVALAATAPARASSELTTAVTAALGSAQGYASTVLVAGVTILALGIAWRFIKGGAKKVSL